MTLPLQHNFTALLAGPTSCGKTVWVYKLFQNIKTMIDTEISEIIWCYGAYQPLYDEMKEKISTPMKFVEGIPMLDDIAPEYRPPARIVVLDDLMRHANENVSDFFTKGSHHKNLSVIFITQNIFHQNKSMRDISLNAHYVVLFKSPRERFQIVPFSRQIYPENPKYVQEAFYDSTTGPHGYLLFDLKQNTPDHMRLRTLIFPDENTVVYVPKNYKPPV